ncbi:type II 3-dehydroquinate dehydratase [Vibrio sp. SCSIO 43136]|uniref:type II 3-dehydroquinate dehydratase n=1 Tax=Vibrio sp. SCSIO 43136 TaxID=2819101 RepID=UPI002076557A|nr:type II 3-dehydroquinate dehydratase [Vibrio sp. SCSIO 43136]USD65446.1 type II 3-dehydroquinate dehydratase [Vibrio sp. SCSIO 43136]
MSAKSRILVLNGPNLNLLGLREPAHYGSQTLSDIVSDLEQHAQDLGVEIEHLQSNREYELLEAIHAAYGKFDFIVINPAAFTHTSVALRDALLGVAIPFIEVHLSNVHSREPFRHHSYLSDKAVGVICGLGAQGYQFALSAAVKHLSTQS